MQDPANLSGQERADLNHTTFISWMAAKTDADYREMVFRGQLSRQEIAKECGFSKSVLHQNPRVKEALKSLEDELRERGILPPLASAPDPSSPPPSPNPANPRAAADKARLKRLEAENAALRAEMIELRAQLERYRRMDTVLTSTGRLPL